MRRKIDIIKYDDVILMDGNYRINDNIIGEEISGYKYAPFWRVYRCNNIKKIEYYHIENNITYTNKRLEIKNKFLFPNLPEIIYVGTENKYLEDDTEDFKEEYEFLSDLYVYKYEKTPSPEWRVIDDFELVVIAVLPKNYREVAFYNIPIVNKNVQIDPSIVSGMLFPNVIQHEAPCSIPSYILYDIIRDYIRNNINPDIAYIAVDGRNYFEVKKRDNNSILCFEMTNKEYNHPDYSVIDRVAANNFTELINKINTYLCVLIDYINKPLQKCQICNGTGFIMNYNSFKHFLM